MKFTESEWRPKRLVINGSQWIIDAFSFSDFNFIFKKDIVGSKNPIPPFLSACKIFRHLDTGFITMTYSFKNCSSIGVMNSSFSSANNFFISRYLSWSKRTKQQTASYSEFQRVSFFWIRSLPKWRMMRWIQRTCTLFVPKLLKFFEDTCS